MASALEISYRLSTNHNQEFRCAIYTGITLIALVLHFFALCYIRPALLSANLTRVPFSCILSNVIHDSFIIDTSLITCKLRFFRRISWITTFSWKKNSRLSLRVGSVLGSDQSFTSLRFYQEEAICIWTQSVNYKIMHALRGPTVVSEIHSTRWQHSLLHLQNP